MQIQPKELNHKIYRLQLFQIKCYVLKVCCVYDIQFTFYLQKAWRK